MVRPAQAGRNEGGRIGVRALARAPQSKVRGVLAHTRGARAPARDGARARAARASAVIFANFYFFFFFIFTIFLGC